MEWRPTTILAATDFSEASTRAVERAASLALQHGARLRLVHSLGEGDWLARWSQRAQELAAKELWRKSSSAALERIGQEHSAAGAVVVDAEVVVGPLHECLQHEVDEHVVDLLVIGPHGAGRLRRSLLGSTADRMLRSGTLPVLLVRTGAVGPYARVATATDFSTASRRAATLALRVAPQATHYLLHADQLMVDRDLAFAHRSPEALAAHRDEALAGVAQDMAAFAGSLGADGRKMIRAPREGPASRVLEAFVREADIELMVLGARARSRWEANLLGSTALFAITGLDCDVLLVPPEVN